VAYHGATEDPEKTKLGFPAFSVPLRGSVVKSSVSNGLAAVHCTDSAVDTAKVIFLSVPPDG